MSCVTTYKLACLGIVSAVTLSACSKGPSVAEAQNALEESMFVSSRVAAAVTGDPMDERVQVERVDNCKGHQNGSSYTCDVEYVVLSRSGARPMESIVESIEFRESSEGWVILD